MDNAKKEKQVVQNIVYYLMYNFFVLVKSIIEFLNICIYNVTIFVICCLSIIPGIIASKFAFTRKFIKKWVFNLFFELDVNNEFNCGLIWFPLICITTFIESLKLMQINLYYAYETADNTYLMFAIFFTKLNEVIINFIKESIQNIEYSKKLNEIICKEEIEKEIAINKLLKEFPPKIQFSWAIDYNDIYYLIINFGAQLGNFNFDCLNKSIEFTKEGKIIDTDHSEILENWSLDLSDSDYKSIILWIFAVLHKYPNLVPLYTATVLKVEGHEESKILLTRNKVHTFSRNERISADERPPVVWWE